MPHRLCLAAVCVFAVAITARTVLGVSPAATGIPQAPPPKPAAAPAQAKPAPAQPPAAQPPGEYAGSDTCELCHEDQVNALKPTKHGQAKNPRTPAADHGCESCHGPLKAHVDDENNGHVQKMKDLKPAQVSQTCLTCHNRAEHAGWDASAHAARNLSCTTCHSVHSPKSVEFQLVKSTQTQVCATCHRQQVAKTERAVAHMPVR